jgi:rhamnulokinase
MLKAIQDFCRETMQRLPKTDGEFVVCAYRGIALKYNETLASLEKLTGQPIELIHIVGGGSQSKVLNQLTANTCRRPVIAGPVEGTAIGNLLAQVRASGEIGSLVEMRAVIRSSSKLVRFEPALLLEH